MAFLDNSGDIILDAVLTDTGRMRLAKGDGSFNIVKFALGDDEISYELYDKNHASGSAYYDIEILQTPVLEAFTNNRNFLLSQEQTYFIFHKSKLTLMVSMEPMMIHLIILPLCMRTKRHTMSF